MRASRPRTKHGAAPGPSTAERPVDPYVDDMRRRYPGYVLPPPREARRIIDEAMGEATLTGLLDRERRERP